jgi:hypothetical protein
MTNRIIKVRSKGVVVTMCSIKSFARIGSCAVVVMALCAGCSTFGHGEAQADGAQVGQAAGQMAGSQAMSKVPFGGMLGGIAGRHAGAAAGQSIDKAAATPSAQPAGARMTNAN